jgi:N-acetylglucosamine kinase-like BadF-type ATPase
MKSIIAIDSGGSKSKCALFDLDGETIFEITGSGANILINEENRTAADLFYLIERCIEKYNLKVEEVEAIIIGAAGAGRKHQADSFRKVLIDYSLSKRKSFNNIFIESDIRIALEGAHAGKPGAVLIAGTGSIIAVKDADDNFFTLGGYGRVVGDEGGGYSIARKTLNVFSKQIDGLIPKSHLFEFLKDELSVDERDSLVDLVYSKDFNIAQLSEAIITVYNKDDHVRKIINDESDDLIKLVEASINKTGNNKLNLCLMGGLLENENIYSSIVRQKIKSSLPEVDIKTPLYSALEGAFILAQKYIGGK